MKEIGERKETWQRTSRLTHKQLSSPVKIIRNDDRTLRPKKNGGMKKINIKIQTG